jgi:hypothetical protein
LEEGKGFFCPTPDGNNQWRCISEYQLCDHMRDCPNAEDEHPTHCLFYSVVKHNYITSFGNNSTLPISFKLVFGGTCLSFQMLTKN